MKTIPQEALLREHLVASSGWVREQLRRADLGCNFSLEIKIEGPIQTGDAKLTYKLGPEQLTEADRKTMHATIIKAKD